MKILIIKKETLGREAIDVAFKSLGHETVYVNGEGTEERTNVEVLNRIKDAILRNNPDMVFSSNYYPIVSNACNEMNIKYVSWVYDCPQIALYSCTMLNPCNYVFLFDKAMYNDLVNIGLKNVFYAPMASSPERFMNIVKNATDSNKYKSDVSFVGALYNEEHNLFDKFEGLSEKTKGYIDGIMEAQMKISGYYFIDSLLSEDIVKEMVDVTKLTPLEGGAETPEYVFSQYFIARKITQMERERLLKAVSEKYSLKLYTWQGTPNLPKAENMGIAPYNTVMPVVFNNSKINLNITLRSIRTGVPLRAFDILACQGFLLSNYQEDYFDCFEPGADFVYYEDENDMMNKIEYFLGHDKDRTEIALNGYAKVVKYHTYEERLKTILEIVFANN